MKNHYCRTLFPYLLTLAYAPSVLALSSEEEELALVYGDKSTISIATGSQQPLHRAPAVATVITSKDIEAIGARNLDEVLETVPGVHVSRTSVRYSPVYIIRGIGGGGQTNPQVLMLQNGIPMTTMYYGDKGSAWMGVPVDNIARIEIIRGPGSALYGADAYAGVINVITKTAEDAPGNQWGIGGGSFNTKDGWVQHGGTWGAADVAAYLHLGSTDGIREVITKDAQSLKDQTSAVAPVSLAPGPVNTGYNSIDGSLVIGYEKWHIRSAYKLRDKLQTGAGVSSALDPNSYSKAEHFTNDVSWLDPLFAAYWSAGATASMLYYSFTYPTNVMLYPPGSKIGGNTFANGYIGGPNQWEKQFRLSANATYMGFTGQSIRLGLGHDYLNMYKTKTVRNYDLAAPSIETPVTDYTTTTPHIRPHLRRVNYVYAQDEWNFIQDWTFTAGLRHDNYSDFGGTTNPRLALVWDATFDLTAKLLYGSAYRAPSFNEQYGINPVANGNPNLRPETIKTTEAALSWKANKDTQLNLSLFRSAMQDIIRLVGTSYQNTGAQHGSGMEMEAVWDYSRTLRLTGNYSYQKNIDDATHQDAGYAPRHHLYARADWRMTGTWQLDAQANWVADRKRAGVDTRTAVPDYRTVDLSVRSAGEKSQWDFAASVRNLFNATVLEPSLVGTVTNPTPLPNDLPMAPRSLYVQAILNL